MSKGFDHHPGSLFLNLEAMQQRWHNLAATIRASGIEVEPELAKDVMRALHTFYLMEAFGPGGTFRGEDIYYYVRRNIERRFNGGSMQTAIGKALALPQQLDREKWQHLLFLLSQDQYHLGFLHQEEGTLRTETAYLDYVVGPEANPDVLQYVEENFSGDDRARLGLTITRYNFQDVFRRVELKDEKSLEKLARRIKRLQLHRNAEVWNQITALCPTFGLAHNALILMTAAGVTPNVVTFNTLMDKAKDYASAQGVIDKMTAAGVAPNVVTFNTLMDKAKDYASAQRVIDKMTAAGVAPDVVTFTTLMDKAKDYASAQGVIDKMTAAGVAPNVFTFSTLFSKDLQGVDPDKLLLWYWGLKYHPEGPLQACIASYRRAGEIEHALLIALHYPHLAAAQRVTKENGDAAIRYFQSVVDRLPSDGDANLALGLVFLDSAEKSRAIPLLEIALSDAQSRTMIRRIDYIQRILSDLGHSS
jgi:tetratricopeptide (TPR) repeat protein